MDAALYAFAQDLPDVDAVPSLLADHGVTGLAIATAYHAARDVTPHGQNRVTSRRAGMYVEADTGRWTGAIAPPVLPIAADRPIERLRAATARAGARLHAWTVFLHSDAVGIAHPELTAQNCFGDRAAPDDLCPAQPAVRDYAVSLAREAARRGPDSVIAESLCYPLFDHGYHHERCFVRLGALDRFLLGLCFCARCLTAVGATGVDAERARQGCVAALDGALRGDRPGPDEVTFDTIADYAGDQVRDFVLARRGVVTTLVREVAEAVADEGSQLVFMDLTGASKGYADGLPTGAPAAADAWQSGIDLPAVAASVTGITHLAYARDPARVTEDVAAYRRVVGPKLPLRTVLRPSAPDTGHDRPGDLASKVRAASDAGCDAVDFYHYGLAPLADLAAIRGAVGVAD